MSWKKIPDSIDVVILTELKKYPPSSIRQIGLIINRSYVIVKQRIDWLEKMGYVQQAPNAPKGAPRSKILTQRGFEYLEYAKRI